MKTLIATRDVFYDGKTYTAGQEFRATNQYAQTLITIGYAAIKKSESAEELPKQPQQPEQVQPPEPKPSSPKPMTTESTPELVTPRRTYRRRDLKAED